YADAAEVCADGRFHLAADFLVERLPAAARALDRIFHFRRELRRAFSLPRQHQDSLHVTISVLPLQAEQRLSGVMWRRGGHLFLMPFRAPLTARCRFNFGFKFSLVHIGASVRVTQRISARPAYSPNSPSMTTLPIFWYSRRVARIRCDIV